MTEYKVGDIFLRRSPNVVGFLIRKITKSPVNHAGIVIHITQSGDPVVIEALAKGATIRFFEDLNMTVYRPPLEGSHFRAPTEATLDIMDIADSYGGIGYAYRYIFILGFAQTKLGQKLARNWLRKQLGNKEYFCSQLVDKILGDIGFHLFNDGRLPQDVTPGDILDLAERESWQKIK